MSDLILTLWSFNLLPAVASLIYVFFYYYYYLFMHWDADIAERGRYERSLKLAGLTLDSV